MFMLKLIYGTFKILIEVLVDVQYFILQMYKIVIHNLKAFTPSIIIIKY